MTATTILYIEDNPQNRHLVRRMLQDMPYQILEAVDGVSGLQMVEQYCPDLILLDINLPDIDGLDLATRLRSMPDYSHIPIIALTANVMDGDRTRCLEAGCSGYLPKPVYRQELKCTIARFLDSRTTQPAPIGS